MCPECQEALVAFELEGIEIDHCVNCKGTWLDAGELEMFLELAGEEPGGLTAALHEARRGEKAKRRCPRCNRRLRILHHENGERVELDECPAGHGLWFDHSEILIFIKNFDRDGAPSGEASIDEQSQGEEKLIAHFFADLFRHELEAEQDR